jgi:HrpA-like RNA helicase
MCQLCVPLHRADFTTPEILRTPLDALCLQIKVLRLGDVREFLAQAIEPPPESLISSVELYNELNPVLPIA